MTSITQQIGALRRREAAIRAHAFDHDLPVLAKERNPIAPIDWEPLLAAGVQPALVLGAERRWQGRR